MNNKNLNSKNEKKKKKPKKQTKKQKQKQKTSVLLQLKKETTESKELNSKDKKKMRYAIQEEQRKEERQILKDKQQVKKKEKKCSTGGSWTKKGKLEQENWEGMKKKKKRKKKKKKDKVHCSLCKFYVFLCRFQGAWFEADRIYLITRKNWKALMRLVSLYMLIQITAMFGNGESWEERKKKGKKREKCSYKLVILS